MNIDQPSGPFDSKVVAIEYPVRHSLDLIKPRVDSGVIDSKWDSAQMNESCAVAKHKGTLFLTLCKLLIMIIRRQKITRRITLQRLFAQVLNKGKPSKSENSQKTDENVGSKLNFLLNKISVFSDTAQIHGYLIRKSDRDDPYALNLIEIISVESIMKESKILDNIIVRCLFISKRLIAWLIENILGLKFYDKLLLSLKFLYAYILVREQKFEQNWDLFLKISVTILFLDKLFRIYHLGFYFPANTAYFRNSWNIITLAVVSSSFFARIIFEMKSYDLIPLTLFDVFGISENKTLYSLLVRIEKAVVILIETFILVFSILLFFAIVGLQTFNQLLLNHCFDPITGKEGVISIHCGNVICPEGFICGAVRFQPDSNNFDNFSNSFIQVIRVVTLERWTYLMNNIQRTYTSYSWIYFFSLVILGNFFLMNLILVVLRLKFLEQTNTFDKRIPKLAVVTFYNLKELKRKGIYTKEIISNHDSEQLFQREKELKAIHKVFKDVTSMAGQLFSKNGLLSKGAKSVGELFSKRVKYKIVRSVDANAKEKAKTSDRRTRKKKSFSVELKQIIRLRFFMGLYNCLFSYVKLILIILKKFLSVNPFRMDSSSESARMINPFYLKVCVKAEMDYLSLSQEDVIIVGGHKNECNMAQNIKNITKLDYSYEMEGIYQRSLAPYFKDVNLDFISNIGRKNIWNIDLGTLLNKKKNLVAKLKLPIHMKKPKELIDMERYKKKKREIVTQKSLQNFMAENSTVFYNAVTRNRVPTANPRDFQKSTSRISNKRKSTIIFSARKGSVDLKINKIGDYEEKFQKLRMNDISNGVLIKSIWSGGDVESKLSLPNVRSVLHTLSKARNAKFLEGRVSRLRIKLKSYFKHRSVEKVVVVLLLLNILFYPFENDLVELNVYDFRSDLLIVLYIYLNLECILKLFCFRPKKFFRNFTNVIDILVTVSMDVDILLLKTNEEIQDDWIFRMFHALQVLRIFRILLIFRFTSLVTMILKQNFFSFAWLGLLISMLMLSLGIIGMNFFKKDLKIEYSLNFVNLQSAFMTTFQIMTLDNWYTIYEEYYLKDNVFTLFFIFLIIIVGNFIFLNIFLAIILSGFENVFSQDLDEIMEKEGIQTADTIRSMNYVLRKSIKASNQQSFLELELKELKKKRSRTQMILSRFYPFREICASISESPLFSKIMFFVTSISITILGLDTFITDSDPLEKERFKLVSRILLFSTNTMFTFESLVKIISQGLLLGKGAYLKNFFNFTEFTCLMGFYMNLLLTQLDINSEFIRLIDLLRIIGPVKIIYLNPNTKIILLSLVNSLFQLFQIVLVIGVVWLIFAFLGLILYRNRFGFCETAANFGVGRTECESRKLVWKQYIHNFDNLREAFTTLFIISTLDDWSEIMYISSISNNEKQGPIEGNNHTTPLVYFVSFIMIGNYLFIGLFIGVMFSNFSKLRKKVQYKSLTNDQIQWIHLIPQILSLAPVEQFIPDSKIRRKLLEIIQGRAFILLTRAVLFLDLLHQAVLVRNAVKQSLTSLFANMIFYLSLFFYFTEFLFKIIAFGSIRFFSKPSYRFEFVVILSWVLYFVLEEGITHWEFIQENKITRALNLLKSFSLLRFLALFEPIRNFFINIFASMKLMINMTLLLFVIFFIYGIVGCKLFGGIKNGNVIDDYNNFRNIFYAMMTLFRFSTADEWRLVIHDTYELSGTLKGSKWGREISECYFYSFIVMTNFIFMNMFVLIIFDQFEQFFRSNLNPVTFYTLGKKFQNKWPAHAGKDRKFEAIHVSNLISFLKDLGPPLGFEKKESFFSIGLNLINIDIRYDEQGFIYFNELFYVLLKHQFDEYLIAINKKQAAERLLKEKEFFFYQELDKKISVYQRKTNHNPSAKRAVIIFTRSRIPINLKPANPLSIIIQKLIIFRTWKRYSIMEQVPQSRRVALKEGKLRSFSPPKERKRLQVVLENHDPPSSQEVVKMEPIQLASNSFDKLEIFQIPKNDLILLQNVSDLKGHKLKEEEPSQDLLLPNFVCEEL